MPRAQGWNAPRLLLWCVLATWPASFFAASAEAEDWVLPDGRLGIRTAPLLLLSRPDIQADLQLDREQVRGAFVAINELTNRASTLRGKSGAAVIAERRAIDEAQLEWLGTHLSGNQLERLRQIELQWEGVPAMLSRPMVAEYLRLSPDQRQGLARMIAERNTRKRDPATQADDRILAAKAHALLSPQQQELWKNLLGTPLRFASTSPPTKSRDSAAQQAGHTEQRPSP